MAHFVIGLGVVGFYIGCLGFEVCGESNSLRSRFIGASC